MALRNRNPSEPRQADRPTKHVAEYFSGMLSGEPASELQPNYSGKNYNVIDRGEYYEARSGSRKYTVAKLGYRITANASTDKIITTGNHPWVTGDVVYFDGDDIPDPLLSDTAYYVIKTGGNEFRVATTYANAIAGTYQNLTSTGTGTNWVHYGDLNARCDHTKAELLAWLFGKTVYISDKAIGSYSKVLNRAGIEPSGVGMLVPFDKYAVLATSSGIFKITLDDDFYYMDRLNSPVPSVQLTDIAEDPSTGKVYGYLGIYSSAILTGTGNRNRQSDGVEIVVETGTTNPGGYLRDYGEYFYTTPIGINVAVAHTVSVFTLPDSSEGMTHFPYYRTKNIGENSGGVSAIDGIGNRRDQFVWVEDIPVAKAFKVDTQTTPGSAILVSGNQFVRGDVGSVLKDAAGNTSTITGYTNATTVTISAGIVVGTAVYCAIGGGRVMRCSQSGIIVTRGAGDTFTAADVGRRLFVGDGTYRSISKYIDANSVEVADGSDFTDLSVTLRPSSGNFSRSWNDTVPDMPQLDGRESLMDRIEVGYDLYIPRRGFVPLPNSNIVAIGNGYMVVATRDDSRYYYSQVGDKPYCAGQYLRAIQERGVEGAIRHIVKFPFKAIILCKDKTFGLAFTNGKNVGKIDIGEVVYQLPDASDLDPQRGVVAWQTVVFKTEGLLFALTNDSAFRYFDGVKWGAEDLGFAGGLDAVSKEYLKRIDHNAGVVANYNPDGGAKLWLQKWVEADSGATATYAAVQVTLDDTDENVQLTVDSYVDRGSTGNNDVQLFM